MIGRLAAATRRCSNVRAEAAALPFEWFLQAEVVESCFADRNNLRMVSQRNELSIVGSSVS